MKLLLLPAIIFLFSCRSTPKPTHFYSLEAGKTEAQKKESKIFVIFDLIGSSTQSVDKILADEEVLKALDNCIIVRLMCDDRKKMNNSLTVGTYNSTLQRQITGEYYQPMFCFLDKSGARLGPPLGYSKKEDILEYINSFIDKHK
jgi:hypothetical protein